MTKKHTTSFNNYQIGLALIVIAYVITAVTYALATPPLESSDEYKHYPFVQYLQTSGRLPILDPDDPGLWLQEAAQPPLYYALMAGLTFWIDSSDLPEVHQINPHAFIGDPNQVANKNLIMHQADRLAFPWRGTILAVYFIRFVSILIGCGTVVLAAMLGRFLFNEQVGLLAAALTAFNPMFLFISAAVNNDSLAAFMGALSLYLLVRLWDEQMRQPRGGLPWRSYLILGAALGLAILTKLSLGGLLGLAGLTMAFMAWRRGEWRILFGGGIVTLLAALIISGWWFGRNWLIYQDPTGLNAFIAVQGVREQPITWQDWRAEFGTFYRSFWGLFGGVNIAAPQIFYAAANGLALIGGAGLISWVWRRPLPLKNGVWLLAAWGGLIFLLLLRWTVIYPSFQGRLLFPALTAVNILWAAGLLSLIPSAWRGRSAGALAAIWLLIAALLPWQTIRPAYAFPQPVTAVPEATRFDPITFSDGVGEIRLVGVELAPEQSVTPGGDAPVRLTLYWEAVTPVDGNYVSSVQLLGRDLVVAGYVNRYPAAGMIATSDWQPGQIWRDTYHIYADPDAAGPALLRVKASLYDSQNEDRVTPAGLDGEPITLLLVGEARLAGLSQGDDRPPLADFTGLADLMGYELSPAVARPGEQVELRLDWRAQAAVDRDYTLFIHLLDEQGELVGAADAPPLGGDYPTSLWLPGDWIDDAHLLTIPEELADGRYSLLLGFYDPADGERLPAWAQGERQPFDAYAIGYITVER